jgi:hypothetical protein
VTAQAADQPQLCVECRKRPAAYVLDLLGQAFGGHGKIAFPAWACENCVQHVLDQVLDVVSVATVCRVEDYRR